ncbi:MAG: SAF domain-containing protein [Mycobacteriales bacterium]|nr:SAF domain-containing protein [Mycobacteriales bacterium]
MTPADLRRAVRRHRALLAAGLAAGAVAAGLSVAAPAPPPTVEVLAAARDLVAGAVVAQEDLTRVALPVAAVPSGALTDSSLALGRLLAGPVRRGETLTDVRVVGSGLLEKATIGTVAVPLRLADPAAAALLRAGDRVDVLAATDGAPVAATVASGVEVLAVPSAVGDLGEGGLVVVATTPEVAARLAAAAVGGRLSVTVRR